MNARWVELGALVAPILTSMLTGCQTVAFYEQAMTGHLALMHARRPIDEVISSANTPSRVRDQLAQIDPILDHATRVLQLDAGKRFRAYADVHREYVVWNLFVTPELAVEPYRWCYPVIGCAAYRGYFAEQTAQSSATRMRAHGFDVVVFGSPAYSSLGWFDDPVISTFVTWDTTAIAGLIFHELAHSKLFVKDDTQFNESFATFVEREGVRSWLAHDSTKLQRYERAWLADDAARAVVLDWRDRFHEMYDLPLSDFAKRSLKSQMFNAMHRCFDSLPDRLIATRLNQLVGNAPNNATFVPLAQYFTWVPAFAALFVQSGSDWHRFYEAAQELAKLDRMQRSATLDALATTAPAPPPDRCVRFAHRVAEATHQ